MNHAFKVLPKIIYKRINKLNAKKNQVIHSLDLRAI